MHFCHVLSRLGGNAPQGVFLKRSIWSVDGFSLLYLVNEFFAIGERTSCCCYSLDEAQFSRLGIMSHFCDSIACCSCLYDEETRIGRQIDRKISQEMKKHKRYARKEIKMLLLGTGEAGKSTVIKQMRIIHGREFQDEGSRLVFVQPVQENIIESIRILLQNMEKLKIDLEDEKNEENLRKVSQGTTRAYDATTIPTLFSSVSALWGDTGVQECYRRRGDFKFTYLSDSSKYFLDRIAIIADPNYVPSEQDILRVRQSSTGIQEYTFKVKNVIFRVVDVGGQRSERRKWIHCFENVTAMIFVASLSDYDQLLLDSTSQPDEEKAVNRMEESFALFNVVVRDQFLQTASIILFLNKTDIFEEKMEERNFVNYFPDYGIYRSENCGWTREWETARQFVHAKYTNIIQKHTESGADLGDVEKKKFGKKSKEHMLYSHFTCATDTANMDFVTTAVHDHILQTALSDFHLV